MNKSEVNPGVYHSVHTQYGLTVHPSDISIATRSVALAGITMEATCYANARSFGLSTCNFDADILPVEGDGLICPECKKCEIHMLGSIVAASFNTKSYLL